MCCAPGLAVCPFIPVYIRNPCGYHRCPCPLLQVKICLCKVVFVPDRRVRYMTLLWMNEARTTIKAKTNGQLNMTPCPGRSGVLNKKVEAGGFKGGHSGESKKGVKAAVRGRCVQYPYNGGSPACVCNIYVNTEIMKPNPC